MIISEAKHALRKAAERRDRVDGATRAELDRLADAAVALLVEIQVRVGDPHRTWDIFGDALERAR